MAHHWRKPYPAPQFNVVWAIGGSVVLAVLVLLSRHVYI